MHVTLGEGNTPLVESRRVARELGLARLLFKLEGANPTGSYKDRFIAAEVTRLIERGARSCLATSSVNTGASLAAYAARYEIACTIVVSETTPAGKLVQMAAHGARLIKVPGFTTDAGITQRVLSRLSQGGAPLVVSAYRYCPSGMAGVESIGRELAGAAQHVFVAWTVECTFLEKTARRLFWRQGLHFKFWRKMFFGTRNRLNPTQK